MVKLIIYGAQLIMKEKCLRSLRRLKTHGRPASPANTANGTIFARDEQY
jgi:hypothetical protein